MSKISRFFKRILYALPFGMKAGNEEISGADIEGGDLQTINQQVSDERVGKHLLKGEVTQSVKELRYRTYKVNDESKNYKYLGNGIAVEEKVRQRNLKHIKFSQDCKTLTSSVLEDLKHVNDYGVENYTLNITYNNPYVRFKLEEFATQIDVELKDGKIRDVGETYTDFVYTKLHFSAIPNGYEKKSAPFINELKKIKATVDKTEDTKVINAIFAHNEITSSMTSLNFITSKASNDEPDLITYNFVNPKIEKIEEENAEFILTYKWDLCVAVNLKAKFFDPIMQQKYDTKAPKNVEININGGTERIEYCEVCGKKINVYDADVTRSTFGKAMCANCLEKYLESDK